jgi:hypothetical protein
MPPSRRKVYRSLRERLRLARRLPQVHSLELLHRGARQAVVSHDAELIRRPAWREAAVERQPVDSTLRRPRVDGCRSSDPPSLCRSMPLCRRQVCSHR